jgi:MFS family permease
MSESVSIGTKLTLLSCAVFTLLTGASISPALPEISQTFAAEPNAEILTKIVLSVSPLFIAIGGPFWGWVIDRWRCRPVLIWNIVATAVFGVAGAFANSLWTLIVVRALLGLAVSGVTNACYTLTAHYFEGDARNRFMGHQAAVQKIGGLVFVLMGGVLAAISRRATFAVDLLALLVLPGALLAITEPDKRRDVSNANEDRINWRVVAAVWIIAYVGLAIFFTIPTQMPFLLTEMLAASPQQVGIAIATSTLFSAITASLYHRFRAHFGYLTIVGFVCTLVAVSFFMMARANDLADILIALAIGGAGFGLLLPNVMVWVVDGQPAASRGRLMGIMMTAIFLGQFSSPILAQPLVAGFGILKMFDIIGLAVLGATIIFFGAALWQKGSGPQNA